MHCRLGLEEDNGARHTARASEGNTPKKSTLCMKYAMVQQNRSSTSTYGSLSTDSTLLLSVRGSHLFGLGVSYCIVHF